MKKSLIKSALFGSAILLGTMVSCSDKDPQIETPVDETILGADNEDRKFITLTASYPDADGEPGNGGSMAYSITEADAKDATKSINIFADGYGLRSQRTARVQGSKNGNYLYNIQYTGVNGGIFNKYKVNGGKGFEDTKEELNIATIIDASPRWVKSAEGIGVAVKINGATAPVDAAKAEAGIAQPYVYTKGLAKVAVIDLDNPKVNNYTEFEFPFTEEEKKEGYSVGRIDVPILNEAKDKIFIGCNLAKANTTTTSKTVNSQTGAVSWAWASDASNIKGTVTLVLDYPSLANPKLIWSTQSKTSNHSYRTMTQYLGTDGNIYQATATAGSHILRINKSTSSYDNNYNFDLKMALSTSNAIAIKAWKYIKDGVGIALFTETGVDGGYVALLDLNAKTATRLTTAVEKEKGLSTALGQFQNICVVGDNVYLPLTPSGLDGNLYIVNWKNKSIATGAKLKGQSGSFYLGAY